MAKRIDLLLSDLLSTGGPPVAGRGALLWLMACIRAALYLGRLAPGDRLPSVRELARRFRVSPTTVLDMYRTLESDGLVEGRERSGVFVSARARDARDAGRDPAVYKLRAATARKLALHGVSTDEFATLLLRYSGERRGDDCAFAFVGFRESLELIERQLAARPGFRIPFLHVGDGHSAGELSAVLARHPSVRCLVSTFLTSAHAREVAAELGLPLVVIRLAPATAHFLERPPAGRRYVVVRDRDNAEGLRRLACNLARTRGDLPPCANGTRHGGCRWCDLARARQAPGLSFAAIDEEVLLAEFDQKADVVHATATSLESVRARYRGTKKVVPLPVEISEDTVDELMFQYLVGARRRPEPRRPAAAGVRPHPAAAVPIAAR